MNMQEIMRQAKAMQKKIQKVQEEAAEQTVEGSAGGGMVVVTANGRGVVQDVEIAPEVVDKDEIEMLQDLVLAATNQAIERANEMMQTEMNKVTGGMPMPGMF